MKIHKVGTLTLGITLIAMGILFLVQLFLNIPLKFVIQFWPIVFILLGVEILYANKKAEKQEFVYDKIAIILTVFLMFFAMFLAVIGNVVQQFV